MSQTIPKAVKTAGTRRAVFVPGGVADKKAITVSEANSGENISCYLNQFNQAGEQASIQDRRWCSSQVFEIPGEKTKTLQVTYTFNLASPDDDEARLALTEGTRGTIIRFLQKDEDDTTFEGGDWYDAVDVECGEQIVIEGEENALDRIQQKLFIQSIWEPFQQLQPIGKTGWTATITGTPTGGDFTLSVNGAETAAIAHNAAASAVQSALNALSGVTATVTGSAGGPYTITLGSAATLTADGTGLTGGTTPGVTVA